MSRVSLRRHLRSPLAAAVLTLVFGLMAVVALVGERSELIEAAKAARAAQPGCGSDVTARAGVVVTDRGAVAGALDGDTYAYKGVPYAAPPAGDLRWRAPAPHQCWQGERPATAFGPACPQFDDDGTLTGDEDCLTLNVWTPATPPAADALRPVMLFIHGGGNIQGSSAQPVYDGRYMAERAGVVVVTINYRLGALGFLTHPALAAESGRGVSGNYGILDQIDALQWLQRNIGAFGGDRERVMIFGESAGAVDVCVLLASPLARGLFSRAIMESGGCNQPPMSAVERTGEEVAQAVGCNEAADVATCLRGKSVAEIAGARRVTIGVGTLGNLGFRPNVDGYVLTGSPLDVIRAGQHNQVPFIIGTNADETAGLRPPPIPDDAAYRAQVYRLVGQRVGDLVLAQYPAAAYDSPRLAFIAATTDAQFVCPARTITRAAAGGQAAPVYRYVFTHALDRGPARALGAFHGLELAFVFHTLGATGGYAPTAEELGLSDAMVDFWTRFAATGDPNGAAAVAWPAYDPAADSYLRLDSPITIGAGLRTASCDFWASLLSAGAMEP